MREYTAKSYKERIVGLKWRRIERDLKSHSKLALFLRGLLRPTYWPADSDMAQLTAIALAVSMTGTGFGLIVLIRWCLHINPLIPN